MPLLRESESLRKNFATGAQIKLWPQTDAVAPDWSMADTICRCHKTPVRDGVATLYRLPGGKLSGAIFFLLAIGWHPREKKKYGIAQFSAWQTIQRSHAIANGCFVQRQIVSAMKRQPGAMASSFGDKVLSARPVAKFLRKDLSIAKNRVGRSRMEAS